MPSIEKLRTMLESEPRDPFLLYAMAQELANAGAHEDAVSYFDRTIEADADSSYAHFHKARSLEALGRPDEARATLDTGLEAANRSGDEKAASEIAGYRASLG